MKRLWIALGGLVAALAYLWTAGAAPLEEALQFIPRGISDAILSYTHWDSIKSQLGFEFLTSDGAWPLRLELLTRISEDHAAATAYGLSQAENHAETWGWDSSDLEWEAQVLSDELPPVYVLKLRSTFDFGRITSHLLARDFVQTESHGVSVFSHDLDLRAEWIRTTPFSILNTAVLPEESCLILSSSPVAVESFLQARAGEIEPMTADPFAAAAAARLADADSAVLLCGLGTCLRFTPNPLLEMVGTAPTDKEIDEIRTEIAEREPLIPYRVFGAAYRRQAGSAAGTIVFEYDTAALAAQDLSARCTLAREGMSLRHEAPIAETYFTLIECSQQDAAIVLTVDPRDDQPKHLFWMVFTLDAVFAACSS